MKRELDFSTRSEVLNINKSTESIIGAAIEVHRHLGPGLLKSAYEECLWEELTLPKISYKRQLALPVIYKNKKLDIGDRIDLLVNDEVVFELETVEAILPIHEAQTLTYMRRSDKQVGLILNFNVTVSRMV